MYHFTEKMEGMISNIMEKMPGFKFHPGDQELLLRHLKPKIEGTLFGHPCIVPEVEVCQFDPWHLPKHFDNLSAMKSREGAREWIFFSPTKCKYANSRRLNRSTPSGYWKVTGADRDVKTEDGMLIGIKKTLVFHKSRFPSSKRTDWVMHEYHLHASCLCDASYGDQLPYVVCRIRCKNEKGVTAEDYPTENSNGNSPYTSDAAENTQVDKGDTSSYNTPSLTPEYHQATMYPQCAAYQDSEFPSHYYSLQISQYDVYGSLPTIQQLDIDGTSESYLQDSSNAFHCSNIPPPLSPWYTYDNNSGYGWSNPYGGSSNTDDHDGNSNSGYGWVHSYGG